MDNFPHKIIEGHIAEKYLTQVSWYKKEEHKGNSNFVLQDKTESLCS